MKTLFKFIAVWLVLVLFLSGCTQQLTAPKLDVGSTELMLGVSALGDLLAQGYELQGAVVDYPETMPARSFSKLLYAVEKEGVEVGRFALVNTDSQELTLEECVIHSAVFPIASSEAGYIQVNDVDYQGYISEQVKESLQSKELLMETDSSLQYIDGVYLYEFFFGPDGTVEEIRISMDLE